MSKREVNLELSTLVNSRPALEKILGATLPTALTFRVSFVSDEIDGPLRRFDERRDALAKEHGTASPDGTSFTLEGEGREKFLEEMEALGKEPLTLNVPVLKIADLGDREILMPAEARTVRWLFTDAAAPEA
jgi:hypothetical protein